ncbi:MAG: diaminopimelate epimerase, partial [Bacteroidota bacterium]
KCAENKDEKCSIGADGLMLISEHESLDFSMKYFNADGKEGSMCGNGGRCISAYFYHNFAPKKILSFQAIDGEHHSEILNTDNNLTQVRLQLSNVDHVNEIDGGYLLDTGSPHFVKFVDHADSIDVKTTGKKLRYSHSFAPGGVNVNFVEFQNDKLYVRTYERGVEDETLSCGTGVTASAIAASLIKGLSDFDITTRGGNLKVSFQKNGNSFHNVWLTGPATFVYAGHIEI